MRLAKWNFSPRSGPSIVTLLFLCLLVSLGFWQLDRADQKKQQYQAFLARQDMPAINLNTDTSLLQTVPAGLWRKVTALGEFVQDTEILLDNQVVNGEAGYFVLTPFRLSGGNIRVLVNRGWVSAGVDRSVLPDTVPVAGEVEIQGRLTDVPPTGILLENEAIELAAPGVYRVQRVDIAELSGRLGHDFVPYILRLEPESAHGFARNWPVPGSGEAKHLGYAFQWFALALTLLVIYIVVNTSRIRHD